MIVYYNVSEDGLVYGRNTAITFALDGLSLFPNDSFIAVTKDSPQERKLHVQYREWLESE